jgi:hypothetical protein
MRQPYAISIAIIVGLVLAVVGGWYLTRATEPCGPGETDGAASPHECPPANPIILQRDLHRV